MPVIVILSSDAPVEPTTTIFLQEVLTGTVGGFLEVSQVLRGTVQRAEIVMDTYLSGTVAATPASASGVLDLVMSGSTLESFSYSASRGQGSRMDVTVIGDARGGTAPGVTVTAGGWNASFAAPGDLGEWEYERDALGTTTTLHASGGSLTPTTKLPELVAWETQEAKDAKKAAEKALQVARVPVVQRPAALWDGRRMGVDEVVLAALATVPHRLLVAPPFGGYEFRADGGPSYSTLGKSVDSVVSDIWGKVGITAGWEDGVLTVRKPGPVGDVTLGAPVEKERIERITLDAQSVEVTGGEAADTSDSDPYSPDNPKNSPDPAERGENPDGSDNGGNDGNGGGGNKDGGGNKGGGFVGQISPTPQVGEVSAKAIPLTWERMPFSSNYAVESYEGIADRYTLWGLGAQTSATQMILGARPNTIYSIRLVVYATAFENDQTRNIIYLPSEVVQVRTPPEFPDELPPRPVTALEGYNRSETGFGVKWTPPAADPEAQAPPRVGAADNYQVRVLRNGILQANRLTTQSYAYFDGLTVGAALSVEVSALNGAGESAAVTANVQLVNLPPAPMGAVTLTATQDSITATWEPVSGAQDYVVQRALAPVGLIESSLAWVYYNDSVKAPTTPQDGKQGSAAPSKLELLTPGAKPSIRYAVRVYARNGIGNGGYSPLAYIITEAAPPSPEPDLTIAGFEKARTTSLTTSRETVDSREYTTVWKRNGRVEGSQTITWAAVPVLEREGVARITPAVTWQKLSTKTTRNYYEIAGWPLTMTGSVTETLTYDRTPGRQGQVAGREQEKVHQEWSPQGFLNRRTTWRSKGGWTAAEIYEDKVIRRVLNNQRETIQELWLPSGDGLWYYERSGVGVALVPIYTYIGQEAGDWDTIESAPKAIPGERTVSEEAPPQAVLPQAVRQAKADPSPLVRNETPGALDRYALDEPWFTTGDSGSGDGGGDGGGPGPDSPPPFDPPKGPKEPDRVPNGSGDDTGHPEPDAPKENKEKVVPRGSWSITMTGEQVPPGTAEIQTSIPWVRNALALQYYAAMIASGAGPRLRITRTYLLPTNPPSLDVAPSISASGTSGNFSMTVTTETR